MYSELIICLFDPEYTMIIIHFHKRHVFPYSVLETPYVKVLNIMYWATVHDENKMATIV